MGTPGLRTRARTGKGGRLLQGPKRNVSRQTSGGRNITSGGTKGGLIDFQFIFSSASWPTEAASGWRGRAAAAVARRGALGLPRWSGGPSRGASGAAPCASPRSAWGAPPGSLRACPHPRSLSALQFHRPGRTPRTVRTRSPDRRTRFLSRNETQARQEGKERKLKQLSATSPPCAASFPSPRPVPAATLVPAGCSADAADACRV